MTIEMSLAFVLAMSLFVASPGPGMMACVAESMRRGVRGSVPFISGMIIGDIVYLCFAVFGLVAFAQVFGKAFTVIRVIGGLYIIYLGIKLFFAEDFKGSECKVSNRGSFFSGLFITLSNPKVIIFYCGFLPNFMDLSKLTAMDIFVVCMLVAFVISVVMGSYAFFASRTGRLLSKRSAKILNKSAGTVLVGTGTLIALKR
jgi:threonine/homoserine/homoserine lactone efflux protein